MLRILSYNVHIFPQAINYVNRIAGDTTPIDDDTRLQAIEENVRSTDADVISFNELWSDAAAEYLIDALVDTYPHVYKPPNVWYPLVGKMIGSGLLLLSKYPIGKPSFVKFNKAVWTDAIMKKGYIRTVVRDVGLFTTHVQADVYARTRKHNIKELLHGVRSFRAENPNTHVVVIGDLNVHRDYTREYNMLREAMLAEGLHDISVRGHTFNGPGRETCVDYIFSTAPGKGYTAPRLQSSDERKESFVSEYTYESGDISDHYPILAVLDASGNPIARGTENGLDVLKSYAFTDSRKYTIVLCTIIAIIIIMILLACVYARANT